MLSDPRWYYHIFVISDEMMTNTFLYYHLFCLSMNWNSDSMYFPLKDFLKKQVQKLSWPVYSFMRLLTTLPHTGSPRAPKRFKYFNIPVEHFNTDSGAQNHGGPWKGYWN